MSLALAVPRNGCGSLVVVNEILLCREHSVWHAVEDPAPSSLGGEIPKETLRHLEPRRTGGGEMQRKAGVCGQPCLHLGVLMSGRVIQKQMPLPIRRGFPVDWPEKLQPLLVAVARLAFSR